MEHTFKSKCSAVNLRLRLFSRNQAVANHALLLEVYQVPAGQHKHASQLS